MDSENLDLSVRGITNLRFRAERTGVGSRRERWCGCPTSWSRGETHRAKSPPGPRCREVNGGAAVVAADAAMNRNGGHHAEVEHPEAQRPAACHSLVRVSARQRPRGAARDRAGRAREEGRREA